MKKSTRNMMLTTLMSLPCLILLVFAPLNAQKRHETAYGLHSTANDTPQAKITPPARDTVITAKQYLQQLEMLDKRDYERFKLATWYEEYMSYQQRISKRQ